MLKDNDIEIIYGVSEIGGFGRFSANNKKKKNINRINNQNGYKIVHSFIING